MKFLVLFTVLSFQAFSSLPTLTASFNGNSVTVKYEVMTGSCADSLVTDEIILKDITKRKAFQSHGLLQITFKEAPVDNGVVCSSIERKVKGEVTVNVLKVFPYFTHLKIIAIKDFNVKVIGKSIF